MSFSAATATSDVTSLAGRVSSNLNNPPTEKHCRSPVMISCDSLPELPAVLETSGDLSKLEWD